MINKANKNVVRKTRAQKSEEVASEVAEQTEE